MSGYHKNPWVTFLRQYGAVANNDASYDEHVLRSARRNGVKPLRFDSGGMLEEIVENFRSSAPRSIVLTGTAGDGKTWLCREAWERLGGTSAVWNGDESVRRLALPCGATLVVLKDLSEVRDEASKVLAVMAESIYANGPAEVFLIAANDGQLRQAWERVPRKTPAVSPAAQLVEDLLVLGQHRAERAGLVLFNLSRQSSAALLGRVLDALLAHEGWSKCDGCPGQRSEGPRCPVWANRERLHDPLFRQRLHDLLTLCDESGFHLPVRQLLVLAANVLLGYPDKKDPLLRCQDVEGVVRAGRAHLASPYRNVFGENLPESRRDALGVFEVLRRFGVGDETSNRIDNLLVYGHDDPELQPEFAMLFQNDMEYGANDEFVRSLDAYLEGREVEGITPFPEVAVAQRQRLFFTLDPAKAESMGLWELTVFRFAGEFLDGVLRPLSENDPAPVSDAILRPLVRGLNRVFTGRLTEDDDALWIASSGSHSQARVCRVFEHRFDVIDWKGPRVAIALRDKRPAIVVTLPNDVEVTLPLHLVRFEFLCRVAEGALSSNFSRECYEDILSFKSRILRALRAMGRGGPRPQDLQLLQLDERGKLKVRRVNVSLEVSR